MQIINLLDAHFKTLVKRMLSDLRENFNRWKTIKIEIKNKKT